MRSLMSFTTFVSTTSSGSFLYGPFVQQQTSTTSCSSALFSCCGNKLTRTVTLLKSTMAKAFIGQPAPAFKAQAVVNGAFEEVSLEQFLGTWVVLFFYPLDFTFVCPTEIIAFSEANDQFKALNTQLLACSVDSQFTHLAWTNTARKDGGLGKINIPLVADLTKSISSDYGVLLEDEGIALRGLFIIDPKGVVRQITINDLPVGRSVTETVRLVEAFQFTDEHGEVCPANWNKDSNAATIVPEVDGSKAYFGAVN